MRLPVIALLPLMLVLAACGDAVTHDSGENRHGATSAPLQPATMPTPTDKAVQGAPRIDIAGRGEERSPQDFLLANEGMLQLEDARLGGLAVRMAWPAS